MQEYRKWKIPGNTLENPGEICYDRGVVDGGMGFPQKVIHSPRRFSPLTGILFSAYGAKAISNNHADTA